MIAWTWAGAPGGAIASPSVVSVAWSGFALMPLWASWARTWALVSGWASATSCEELETLTPALVPAGGAVRGRGAVPATGWTACGCTWNVGADAVVVLDELDELDELDVEVVLALRVVTTLLCCAQPAQSAAAAAAIRIGPRPRI